MKLGRSPVILAAIAGAVPHEPPDPSDYSGLHFTNGKFEITMFNDLHMGDRGNQRGYQKGANTDELTITVLNKVLDYEPTTNLAVLNGDLMSCEWVDSSGTYSLLDKIMDPFLTRKLPFAITW